MDYVKFDDNQNFYYERSETDGKFENGPRTQHYHNLFEIYFLESGSCNYFIDNKSYEVLRGDIILIPEGVIHNTMYKNEPHSRMLINCSGRFIPASVISVIPSMIYLYRNPEITDQVYGLFKKIENEYIQSDEFSSDILCCYTHMLFFLLARNKNKCTKVQSSNAYIETIIRYIQKNYSTDISLSKTAKMYSVSPEHLSRTFKKETGFGFCEYVTLVRLQQAEQVLRHANGTSISEIAYACGFNDSNYFSQKFKNAYGFPPSKLKKSVK